MSARGTSFSFVYMKEALLLGVVVQTSAAWTRLPALKDYKSLRPLEGGGDFPSDLQEASQAHPVNDSTCFYI